MYTEPDMDKDEAFYSHLVELKLAYGIRFMVD